MHGRASLRVEPRPGGVRERQPLGEVAYEGRVFHPGQGNNACVFPGIGLGVVACRARIIPDELFLQAARALAGLVGEDDLARGPV